MPHVKPQWEIFAQLNRKRVSKEESRLDFNHIKFIYKSTELIRYYQPST